VFTVIFNWNSVRVHVLEVLLIMFFSVDEKTL